MAIPEIVSVAKAKAKLSELLKQVKEEQAVYEVISHSEPMAIVISVEEYKALLQRIEDLEDGIAVLEAKMEDAGKPSIPWEQFEQEQMVHGCEAMPRTQCDTDRRT